MMFSNVSPSTWWIYGGFMVDSWWIHGGFMVDSSWIHGGFMVDSSWIHGGFMADSWWIHGGFMFNLSTTHQFANLHNSISIGHVDCIPMHVPRCNHKISDDIFLLHFYINTHFTLYYTPHVEFCIDTKYSLRESGLRVSNRSGNGGSIYLRWVVAIFIIVYLGLLLQCYIYICCAECPQMG